MEQTEGLKEFVRSKRYREAIGLPEEICEEYRMLAQGEYNRNYIFRHPITGKRLILRINFGSQMHLQDQVGYEYRALKMLERSGRTPKAYYADGSREFLPYGAMVMEYLPGRPLDYRNDIEKAAACLADIHSVETSDQNFLLSPEYPLKAILEECEVMSEVYMNSSLGDLHKKRKIRQMLDIGWRRAESMSAVPHRCMINTELNNTNFLINQSEETDYLIDWEKPLYADPAQDLGHFLAPTTTLWKTDDILGPDEVECFMRKYIQTVDKRYDTDGIRERTNIYIPVTCLRGITWCAMAWVEYHSPGRAIMNPSTAKKLEMYIEDEFLDRILKQNL